MANQVATLGLHSVLQPLGVHSQQIHLLWQIMLWVCGAMYVLVLAFLIVSIVRRGQRAQDEAGQAQGLSRLLVAWAGLVVAGLFALALASFLTDRALGTAATRGEVELKITGHQWWWEVEYLDADRTRRLRTANEIHLPVNSQVHIALASKDVIHSFWVPNLHGKLDLIPGRPAQIRLEPRHIGLFRGQCAEFCGVQHAHMALEVVVESPEKFRAWKKRQLEAAAAPAGPLQVQGYRVYSRSGCPLCHTITGTQSLATFGPDLSHVGSRRTLAAGTLLNTPQNLRAWIENPQIVKPGNRMPRSVLRPDELDRLVAYLESLQ